MSLYDHVTNKMLCQESKQPVTDGNCWNSVRDQVSKVADTLNISFVAVFFFCFFVLVIVIVNEAVTGRQKCIAEPELYWRKYNAKRVRLRALLH